MKNNKKKFIWGCMGCLGIFVILAIVFAGCAALVSNDSSISSNSSSKSNKEKVYKIGETAKNGDLEVTVNAIETTKQVGPSIAPTQAKDTYVVADVTIKNKGNDSLTIDTNMFKLKAGDKTADADSTGSISANQSDNGSINNSFFLEKVNPDSTIKGKVAFDVSEKVANDKHKKLVVSSSLFSFKEVTFDLTDEKQSTKKKENKRINQATVQSDKQTIENITNVNSNDNLASNNISNLTNIPNSNKVNKNNAFPKTNEIQKNQITTTHDESQIYDITNEQYQAAQDLQRRYENGTSPSSGIGGGPGLSSPVGETFQEYKTRVQEELDTLTVPE